MIDEIKLCETLDKVINLSFEERNVLYFKIKSVIEDATPDEAARSILSKIVEYMDGFKKDVKVELINDDASEGKEFKGSFRRVPS
jgi:hypothetical protein